MSRNEDPKVAGIAHIVLCFCAAIAACGAEEPDPGDCPATGTPSLRLGTGEAAFEPLAPGQDLRIARGGQGGCHLWLGLEARGLDGRRVTVDYRIDDLDAAEEVLRSRQTIRLRPRASEPGVCEAFGFQAFLQQPWRIEDHRVRVQVTLTDQEEVAVTDAVEGVARWPEPVEGLDRETLCGPRT